MSVSFMYLFYIIAPKVNKIEIKFPNSIDEIIKILFVLKEFLISSQKCTCDCLQILKIIFHTQF